MNGGADLGGMMGFGPVVEEENEPNFHHEWEARVMAMVVALGASGQWNIDQSRFARERLRPDIYQSTPYYAIWYAGVTELMIERGMVTAEEVEDGRKRVDPVQIKARLAPADVGTALKRGGPADRPPQGQPAFSVGDRIVTRNMHPKGHTRLPRYARGRKGSITRILGFHVFPDSNARGQGEDPQWLYQVAFSARELWGDDRNQRDKVTLDLWQPYLIADA